MLMTFLFFERSDTIRKNSSNHGSLIFKKSVSAYFFHFDEVFGIVREFQMIVKFIKTTTVCLFLSYIIRQSWLESSFVWLEQGGDYQWHLSSAITASMFFCKCKKLIMQSLLIPVSRYFTKMLVWCYYIVVFSKVLVFILVWNSYTFS